MGRTHSWLWLFIRYRKGSMNTVIDALSRIHAVNMLIFIEIKFDLYEQLWWKYLDESGTDAINTSKETFTLLTIFATVMERFVSLICFRVKKKILFECHDVPSTRHHGLHRTLVLISTHFFGLKCVLMLKIMWLYVTNVRLTRLNALRLQVFYMFGQS